MTSVQSKFFTIFLSSLFFTIFGASLYAWSTVNGIAISTVANNQQIPAIVSDDSGGAIIAWEDKRNGSNYDIYAQDVDSTGSTLWTMNGVAICTAGSDQEEPQIVSDGAGGAIVTWWNYNYDIYAQRVNSTGSTLWSLNGVPIRSLGSYVWSPQIISDDSGGAIITWADYRAGISIPDIYAQRVNSAGSTLWTSDGIPICTVSNTQFDPTIVGDGSGGAFITWEDDRNGGVGDIYAQRVNSNGSTLWTLNGIAICTVSDDQQYPTIVSDGAGGVIITWQDYRNGSDYDIYAQRVNSTGSSLWSLNGVALCTVVYDQQYPRIIKDDSGGAIITWNDYRDGSPDIYTQRVDSTGSTLWTLNGVAICTAGNWQLYPLIVSDGTGGAFITWRDQRSGSNWDIYAQRVDSTGITLWTLNGVAICTAADHQFDPTIISDGSGGAIITWGDYRSGDSDIYAQQVYSNGDINPPAVIRYWELYGTP